MYAAILTTARRLHFTVALFRRAFQLRDEKMRCDLVLRTCTDARRSSAESFYTSDVASISLGQAGNWLVHQRPLRGRQYA